MAKTCTKENCNRPVFSHGLCLMHAPKKNLKRTPLKPKPPKKVPANARSEKPYKNKTGKKGGKKKRSPKDILWEWYSRWNRLFHSDENGYCKCFTCPNTGFWKGDGIQCGHFITRAEMSTFIHHMNTHPQCIRCNKYRSGEQFAYGKNIDLKYGEGSAEELYILSKQHKKYTQAEYKELTEYYKAETFKLLKDKGLEL